MATQTITPPRYVSSMSRGASPTASFSEKEYGNGLQRLQDSYVLGQIAKGSISELDRVYTECSCSDWDGYGAEPVSASTHELAGQFLLALPPGTPAPSIGAEPDGHLSLEWHKSPYWTLSVSVSPDGQLHFAALMGVSKQYGSEPFYGEVPQTILNLIHRVS